MKTELIHEFIVTAETMNMTAAARKLYISQSNLSRHIKELEDELDCELFIRDPKSFTLTRAGRIFLERAKEMLDIYDCARQELSVLSKEQHDVFRIFISYYLANDFIQQMLATYALEYPSTYIHYVSAPPEQLAKELRYGTADAVVAIKADIPNLEKYHFHPLYRIPFIAVSTKDHPWVGQKSVSMNDLRNETFLRADSNAHSNYWENLSKVCKRYGFEPKFSRKFLRQDSMLMAIGGSDDVAILAAHWASFVPPNLSWVPISDEDAFSQIYLIYDKNRDNDTIINQITNITTFSQYNYGQIK